MDLSKKQSLVFLHLIILIWGFTGILGKLIDMSSTHIVLNRMAISFICLLVINKLFFKQLLISKKNLITYSLIGILIAIHWICFFEAIKESTVSLALICLSSVSLFTSIIEPIFYKRKIYVHELILSLFVISGILIIFNYENLYLKAIILSIISAFFAALFTVLNHNLINQKHNSTVISSWEMFGGTIGIIIYLLFSNQFNFNIIPNKIDVLYILILSVICTAFAFSASIEIMKKISPFTVNISVNLEPIYAIILALIIFKEEEKMTTEFYIGSIIIISSIFINTLIKKYNV
tara:strand:+ start:13648 stop:14523 length:876 start_codon:yes stop_codon:yes gene_type:complete